MKRPAAKGKSKLKFPRGADVRAMLAALPEGDTETLYAPKDTVFRQGDPADAVYYIENGNIEISVVSDHGKEGVIATLGSGKFFGEGCLAGQVLHMASAIVMDPSSVVRIGKQTMVAALHEQPRFAEVFTTFLLMRNIQIESDLVDQLFYSTEKRLARVLLLLANFGKDGMMEQVIPKVSQDALAARVGTTRSRINFFMNKFRKIGFIEYNGTLKVHSSLMTVLVQDAVDAPEDRRSRGGLGKPARWSEKGRKNGSKSV